MEKTCAKCQGPIFSHQLKVFCSQCKNTFHMAKHLGCVNLNGSASKTWKCDNCANILKEVAKFFDKIADKPAIIDDAISKISTRYKELNSKPPKFSQLFKILFQNQSKNGVCKNTKTWLEWAAFVSLLSLSKKGENPLEQFRILFQKEKHTEEGIFEALVKVYRTLELPLNENILEFLGYLIWIFPELNNAANNHASSTYRDDNIFGFMAQIPSNEVKVTIIAHDPVSDPTRSSNGLSMDGVICSTTKKFITYINYELFFVDLYCHEEPHNGLKLARNHQDMKTLLKNCRLIGLVHQGVLLINAKQMYMKENGDLWKPIIQYLVKLINDNLTNVAFLLCGTTAIDFCEPYIDTAKHHVSTLFHPSYPNIRKSEDNPKKWHYSMPFSTANLYLHNKGKKIIDWTAVDARRNELEKRLDKWKRFLSNLEKGVLHNNQTNNFIGTPILSVVDGQIVNKEQYTAFINLQQFHEFLEYPVQYTVLTKANLRQAVSHKCRNDQEKTCQVELIKKFLKYRENEKYFLLGVYDHNNKLPEIAKQSDNIELVKFLEDQRKRAAAPPQPMKPPKPTAQPTTPAVDASKVDGQIPCAALDEKDDFAEDFPDIQEIERMEAANGIPMQQPIIAPTPASVPKPSSYIDPAFVLASASDVVARYVPEFDHKDENSERQTTVCTQSCETDFHKQSDGMEWNEKKRQEAHNNTMREGTVLMNEIVESSVVSSQNPVNIVNKTECISDNLQLDYIRMQMQNSFCITDDSASHFSELIPSKTSLQEKRLADEPRDCSTQKIPRTAEFTSQEMREVVSNFDQIPSYLSITSEPNEYPDDPDWVSELWKK